MRMTEPTTVCEEKTVNEISTELEMLKLKFKYTSGDMWFIAIMSGLLGGCCAWMVLSLL